MIGMGGDDLELFERSLRAATEQHTGDALDAAVAELGWDDALVVRHARRGVDGCSSSRARRARGRRRWIASSRSRSGASSTPTPRW